MTGYEVDETELNPAQFAVVASCAEGYEGIATVAACGEGGGEYTLGGCAEAPQVIVLSKLDTYRKLPFASIF